MVVASELDKLNLKYTNLEIGGVNITENITQEKLLEFDKNLKKFGLEVIHDKKVQTIEKIKNLIVEQIHYSEDDLEVNFSEFISSKLEYDYVYLSNLFSEITGTSIQKFIIAHKIERAKELIIYDELNLSEIAWKLHYTSVQHLSGQFKKVTGLTPSYFKKLREKRLSAKEKLDLNLSSDEE